jgi:hypothetical protein
MADGSRFNVDDPRFRSETERPTPQRAEWAPEAPVKQRSWVSTCLVGCLITFVMLLAVVAVGVYWVTQNWRDWASSFGSDAIKAGINETDLPAEEKDQIGLEVDRLATELREGRLTGEELTAIFEEIMQSPLMTTIVASAIEKKYIADSGLDDAEKNEGRQTLRRFLRGAVDGNIPEAGMNRAMRHVATRREGQKNWELKNSVTDAELREFFKEAKIQADDADIPNEPVDIDPSDEFRRIIDEAMQAQ